MINFEFFLSNPWSANQWRVLLNKHGKISKNKAWEFNVYSSKSIISIDFGLSIRSDHAGIRMQGGVLGYEIEFLIYDTRHWDHNNNDWVKYDAHSNSEVL